MTAAEARSRAKAFLRTRQLLSAAEAEQALGVADMVLAQAVSRLRDAAAGRDAAVCAETAHSLKGNLLNLGLPELAETAQTLQEKARQGDFPGLVGLLDALAASLASFRL